MGASHLLLNSLNRSLGQSDAYPFALSAGAMVKLRFVRLGAKQCGSRLHRLPEDCLLLKI